MRTLVAIPVYNEERYVGRVLAQVLQYADDVLVIDDGSTDRTVAMLPKLPVDVIPKQRGRSVGTGVPGRHDHQPSPPFGHRIRSAGPPPGPDGH